MLFSKHGSPRLYPFHKVGGNGGRGRLKKISPVKIITYFQMETKNNALNKNFLKCCYSDNVFIVKASGFS